MSNMSEDIQLCRFRYPPTMLDRTGLDSGTSIRSVFVWEKIMEFEIERLMKSFTEVPFQKWAHLLLEEKERYKADIRANDIFLLQGLLEATEVHANEKEDDGETHLPQMNNQLRTSSNARNNATVQDGRVVVQDVREYEYNENNLRSHFRGTAKRSC
ncbi:hypothetical protein Tco_0547745 [Tanacetum coccineum]